MLRGLLSGERRPRVPGRETPSSGAPRFSKRRQEGYERVGCSCQPEVRHQCVGFSEACLFRPFGTRTTVHCRMYSIDCSIALGWNLLSLPFTASVQHMFTEHLP